MQTFSKSERLTGKIHFDELMNAGKTIQAFPVKAVWNEKLFDGLHNAKVAFSAPKRIFANAVDRNKIKRRMREAYRKSKSDFYKTLGSKKLNIIFIYVSKEVENYQIIEASVKKILTKIGSDK